MGDPNERSVHILLVPCSNANVFFLFDSYRLHWPAREVCEPDSQRQFCLTDRGRGTTYSAKPAAAATATTTTTAAAAAAATATATTVEWTVQTTA
jgi:hypothetical protein